MQRRKVDQRYIEQIIINIMLNALYRKHHINPLTYQVEAYIRKKKRKIDFQSLKRQVDSALRSLIVLGRIERLKDGNYILLG